MENDLIKKLILSIIVITLFISVIVIGNTKVYTFDVMNPVADSKDLHIIKDKSTQIKISGDSINAKEGNFKIYSNKTSALFSVENNIFYTVHVHTAKIVYGWYKIGFYKGSLYIGLLMSQKYGLCLQYGIPQINKINTLPLNINPVSDYNLRLFIFENGSYKIYLSLPLFGGLTTIKKGNFGNFSYLLYDTDNGEIIEYESKDLAKNEISLTNFHIGVYKMSKKISIYEKYLLLAIVLSLSIMLFFGGEYVRYPVYFIGIYFTSLLSDLIMDETVRNLVFLLSVLSFGSLLYYTQIVKEEQTNKKMVNMIGIISFFLIMVWSLVAVVSSGMAYNTQLLEHYGINLQKLVIIPSNEKLYNLYMDYGFISTALLSIIALYFERKNMGVVVALLSGVWLFIVGYYISNNVVISIIEAIYSLIVGILSCLEGSWFSKISNMRDLIYVIVVIETFAIIFAYLIL